MENKNNENKNYSRRNFISNTSKVAVALGLASIIPAESFGATENNHKPLANKVAIITGSSRGIGEAIAKKLALSGFKVVVNCVENVNLAEKVVNDIKKMGGTATWLKADVRNANKVRELFDFAEQSFGGIDVVINNAGVMKLAAFGKMSDEDFDYMVDTNIKGGFNVLREAAKRVRDGGRIISLSSSITVLKLPSYGIYAATKAAQDIYSSILAKELRGRQISVNAIAPGVVNTSLFTNGKTAEQIRMFVDRTPHGRLGEPEDIADVVATICNSDSSWINGETIFANGGIV